MRWLLYFLPNRYALSVPNYSEVFLSKLKLVKDQNDRNPQSMTAKKRF